MKAKKHNGMRPQDILVLLTIALKNDQAWRNIDISRKLNLSQSEVSESIYRSVVAGLIDINKKLQKNNLVDFIIYGLKYVFPVIPSGIQRGVPTAHSAKPLNHIILSSDNSTLVWPYAEGNTQGQGIQPLYPTVPEIALADKQLYELLALIDSIRIGNAREHNTAVVEVKRRLLNE